jgi:hypothetical protein
LQQIYEIWHTQTKQLEKKNYENKRCDKKHRSNSIPLAWAYARGVGLDNS